MVAGTIVVLILAIVIFPAPFAGLFGHGNPHACNLIDSNEGPRAGHPFGFDVQGCDLYANVIYGARPTVTIGLLVTGTSLLIAIVLGSSAAYMGGIVDTVLGRLADVFFGFPFILGALIILTVIPERNVLTVSLVLIIFGWPVMTRLMRSTVLGETNKDYVLAARSLGASNMRILRKHILPNALGTRHRLRHPDHRWRHGGRGDADVPRCRPTGAGHLLGPGTGLGANRNPAVPAPSHIPGVVP